MAARVSQRHVKRESPKISRLASGGGGGGEDGGVGIWVSNLRSMVPPIDHVRLDEGRT